MKRGPAGDAGHDVAFQPRLWVVIEAWLDLQVRGEGARHGRIKVWLASKGV